MRSEIGEDTFVLPDLCLILKKSLACSCCSIHDFISVCENCVPPKLADCWDNHYAHVKIERRIVPVTTLILDFTGVNNCRGTSINSSI